jgi:hypothetical protein
MHRRITFYLGFLLCWGGVFPAQAAPSRESTLKAVFLYHCAHFVDWPSQAFENSRSPIVIGVLASDSFVDLVAETVRGEQVRGRSITVVRYRDVEEIEKCHILFIGDSAEVERGVARSKYRNMLTVSDTDDFLSRGGMVQLDIERNRLRVKINQRTAKTEGLSISSKLLRLSQIQDE